MEAVADRWWNEVWRDGRVDALDDLLADPFVRHTATGTETVSVKAYKARLVDFQRALSRAETRIDERIVDGDRVWTRATSRGLNRQTGELAVVTWMMIQRIADGRIAEHWMLTVTGVDWAK